MNKRRVHEFGSLVETSGGAPKLSILRHAIRILNVESGLLYDVQRCRRGRTNITTSLFKGNALRTIAYRNLNYKFLVSTHIHARAGRYTYERL